MTPQWIPLTLALWMLAQLVIIGLYDLWVTFVVRDQSLLVSSILREWSRQYPIGVVAVGMLLGHLLWPGNGNVRK